MEENTTQNAEAGSEKEEKEISVEHYIGAAVLGAVGALLAFYLYNHLSEDSKEGVKENVVGFAKKQLAKFCEE